MILDRVTISGADDSIRPDDLIPISNRHPFVEWGILLSRSREGSERYPTQDWMRRLMKLRKMHAIQVAGHLCGTWARDLMLGENTFRKERPDLAVLPDRAQLNFNAQAHKVDIAAAAAELLLWGREEYILQLNGTTSGGLLPQLLERGVKAVALFDTSGGQGVAPARWPDAIGEYCGYAGGLHPDYVNQQLYGIREAAGPGQRIWIDVETHVRGTNGVVFDLDKVEAFLEKCAPIVAHTSAPAPTSPAAA